MLVKIIDGSPVSYSIRQLRADNPQVSFPREMGADELAKWDVYEAEYADAAQTRFHTEIARLALVKDGKALITREWLAPELATIKARAVSELSMHRRAKIDAGFAYNGMNVPCDAESQRSYTAAYVLANDFPDTVRKWKLPSGFVELDAAAIKAIAKAAADYVQACFDEQAALVAQVDAATDAEGVEAVLVAARG